MSEHVRLYSDAACLQEIAMGGDHHQVTFLDLQRVATDGAIFYMESGHCHRATLREDGFHLSHSGDAHSCATPTSSIAACLAGDHA